MSGNWRNKAGTLFNLQKQSTTASSGMVVANHPLGSAAGVEMLAIGGSAIDAAISGLFTLSVVEPMMVGIFGGGWINIRLSDGRYVIVDDYPTAPAAALPDMYHPISATWLDYMQTKKNENTVGPIA